MSLFYIGKMRLLMVLLCLPVLFALPQTGAKWNVRTASVKVELYGLNLAVKIQRESPCDVPKAFSLISITCKGYVFLFCLLSNTSVALIINETNKGFRLEYNDNSSLMNVNMTFNTLREAKSYVICMGKHNETNLTIPPSEPGSDNNLRYLLVLTISIIALLIYHFWRTRTQLSQSAKYKTLEPWHMVDGGSLQRDVSTVFRSSSFQSLTPLLQDPSCYTANTN